MKHRKVLARRGKTYICHFETLTSAQRESVTAGRGAIEVHWMLRPGAGFVSHCQSAEHGRLSFLSLLSDFLLNAIKRNEVSLSTKTKTIPNVTKRNQAQSGFL